MGLKDKINDGGAVWFGLVIGWITSLTFHSHSEHAIKDIATIIGVVGGAAVTKLFAKTNTQFAMYCIGMAVGFIIHILVSILCWHGEVWYKP